MNPSEKFKIPCIHFSVCSGCSLNENVNQLPVYMEAQDFFSQRGVSNLAFSIGDVTGWRSRAKLAVRGTASNPLIGLYQAGTHQVVDIPSCLIHHPSINKAVALLRCLITEEQIIPYDESSKSGELRYMQLVVERKTGRVQLGLVFNAENMSAPQTKKWVQALDKLWNWNHSEGVWHSIWLNFNTRRDNVIFGPEWQHVHGETLLWETIAGTEICYQPATFAQANLDLFEKMVLKIKEWVPLNSSVTEFYAGVGVIGLTLAQNSRWVRCCELNPNAEFCFEESRGRLPEDVKAKISFHEGTAEKQQDLMEDANVVIVDPPRKGLDAGLLRALQEPQTVKELIYISCGWNAFQRDCDALLAFGWKIKTAEAYLFFPGSNQIEVVAVFHRER